MIKDLSRYLVREGEPLNLDNFSTLGTGRAGKEKD